MTYKNPDKNPLREVPWRVFLDSSTLQTLQDYREFIYDGGEIEPNDRIWSIPDGYRNIYALRQIMFVGNRALFEFVLSENSLQEVIDRGRDDYLQWALEMLDYWEGHLAAYGEVGSPFLGRGEVLVEKTESNNFDYLSQKDAKLIKDALLLECDAFLTMERRLPKNAPHIERKLGIKVLQPIIYWDLLKPWATLFV